MASQETHFELFLRKSPKSGWVLAEAQKDRGKAIAIGKRLLKSHPHGGVRVMKEKRKADGSYESVQVTTLGNCEDERKKPSRTFVPQTTSSCMSAGDLSQPAARKTYLEVLPRFLERFKVLPGELVYRTDLLETLEASGADITQAIQRVAISRSGGDDLHSIARQLHELTDQAINDVFKQKKNGFFVRYEGSLEDVMAEVAKRPKKRPAFESAISDRLKRETTWPKKMGGLIEIWKEAKFLPAEDQKFVNNILSDFFAEWIGTQKALQAILGDSKNTGEMVSKLIAILEPRPTVPTVTDPLLNLPEAQDLAEAIHLGLLPTAKSTILSRVFDEISSNRRLIDGCLLTEFQLLKKFGDRLVKILQASRRAEMYESFCARSKRLMATDTVDAYLEQFDIVDRPIKLLQLQDNLVGMDARQKLVSIFRGLIGQPRYESAILDGQNGPVQMLMVLRTTQAKLLESDLPEADKLHAAKDVDALGVRLVSDTYLLRSVAQKAGSPMLASLALFRLAADGMPRGRSALLAGVSAGKMLKDPDAMEALSQNGDLKATLRELSQRARAASHLPEASEG